jgi:hypothetical protein
MPSKKEQYKYAKHAAPRPGDERFGAFTQAQLAEMDRRFVERMEWAFRTGREQLIVIGSPLSKSASQFSPRPPAATLP